MAIWNRENEWTELLQKVSQKPSKNTLDKLAFTAVEDEAQVSLFSGFFRGDTSEILNA